MTVAPEKGEWSIKYSDESGVEYGISYDAAMMDSNGENGVVLIESVYVVEWPLGKIDWLVERLIAAKVAMEENS